MRSATALSLYESDPAADLSPLDTQPANKIIKQIGTTNANTMIVMSCLLIAGNSFGQAGTAKDKDSKTNKETKSANAIPLGEAIDLGPDELSFRSKCRVVARG